MPEYIRCAGCMKIIEVMCDDYDQESLCENCQRILEEEEQNTVYPPISIILS